MTTTGVVAALPAEGRCLAGRSLTADQMRRVDNLLIHVCGIGEQRAGQSARRLVAQGVDGLISWGTAAGLVPTLKAGDLLLPKTLITTEGAQLAVDHGWRQRLCAALGREQASHDEPMLHAEAVLDTPERKHQMAAQHDAVAADMESHAVAQAAGEAGLPFLIIRSVVDPVSLSLPDCAMRHVDAYGKAKTSALLRCLIGRPTDLPDMIRVAVAFNKALSTLSRVARVAGADLAYV